MLGFARIQDISTQEVAAGQIHAWPETTLGSAYS